MMGEVCRRRHKHSVLTGLSVSLWGFRQELRAQPQEPGPGVSSQEEEAAVQLQLHHPSARRQEKCLLPADQIQRHGDHRVLHSRSGREGRLPAASNGFLLGALAPALDLNNSIFRVAFLFFQLHYNSKMLKTESPNASRGSSLPRTLSKESKLYGMKDSGPPNAVESKTNSLLPPPPPPIPSGTEHPLVCPCMPVITDTRAPYCDFTSTRGPGPIKRM